MLAELLVKCPNCLVLQIYGGWLPAQKVLPHSLPDEDALDARLFQDAHFHFLRVSAHPA